MDLCFMVDWLWCLTSCELWLRFLPMYRRTFLRSFPQVLVDPLCVTNVTPCIMALTVLQITTGLSVRTARREVSPILDQILSWKLQKHNCFSDSPPARVTAEKHVQKLLKAPVQIHACNTWHCYLHFFLNNCALFLLKCLLLFSSLCFYFPLQYVFHLQIIAPLSTHNLFWTENINALSIYFNMMNILSYFSFLSYWGFFHSLEQLLFLFSVLLQNFSQYRHHDMKTGPYALLFFCILSWSNKQKCIPCYKSFSYP